MTVAQFDVIVVGAGCAGLTAALGLARAGFKVAVVEAARVVGDGGLIGGACFAESLLETDILGPQGVRALAWERRIIERGSFITDGRRLAGYVYRDADAFSLCYTVLRSRFDHNLAETARAYGIDLRTETTVESLIRDGRRIIGVATARGPLYGHLVFLAEGDAGHLLSREGLDRSNDIRDQPTFLYCLQQVLELPSGAIEKSFHLGSDQGVVYGFLLRNPAGTPLNIRGQLCTNRRGLTLSVFLPAVNLQRRFEGEPRQILDWFVDMPVLRPWLREGTRSEWTAGLLRTGGMRDVPYLIDDGLAVGGAAAGLGTDFPDLNLTGPAMATALLLSRAAVHIRAERGDFDRDALARHYLGRLQETRYWREMEFMTRWPSHLERTSILFGHGLDLLLDSASIWAQPRRWLPRKFLAWLCLLARVSLGQWNELRNEILQLGRVLRWREVVPRPAWARLLLDGTLNAFRDLARQPRPHLPPSGALRLHYRAADDDGRASAVPWMLRRWFERFRPVLASIGSILHANDDSPLSEKWTRSFELLLRQSNLLDLLSVAAFALPMVAATAILALATRGHRRLRSRHREARLVGLVENTEARHPTTAFFQNAAHSSPTAPLPPLIRIAWRSTPPEQQAASVRYLPHVCPTRVFEMTGVPPDNVRVALHPERCVFCEACWRMNPLVDWGRNDIASSSLSPIVETAISPTSELRTLFDKLEYKLWEFAAVLIEGPVLVDRPHNDYLEMLARFAQRMTYHIREVLSSRSEIAKESRQQLLELADALVASAEQRTHRVWEGRFSWAAVDGRVLRQHHLALLRRLLALPTSGEITAARTSVFQLDWIPNVPPQQQENAALKHLLADLAAARYLLETLEQSLSTLGPAGAELLTTLGADLRDGLSARTLELNALLSDKPAPLVPSDVAAGTEVYGRYGRQLLEDWEESGLLLNAPGDWAGMEQLQILRTEREELAESERRLLAIATDWHSDSGQRLEDEMATRLGRQAAHILASKLLISRTFSRVDKGDDSELAILLLRVWLDHAAAALDEFALFVREILRPVLRSSDRPLVDPESGPLLRSQGEYLDARAIYASGDFLLIPLDLLQPRLVPEIVGEKEIAVVGPNAAALFSSWKSLEPQKSASGRDHSATVSGSIFYLAEALIVETIGRYAADPSAALDLERACARVVLARLRRSGGGLPERCVILRMLTEIVIPRWLNGGIDTRARHLQHDVLELESLKADFRHRLIAGWQVYGEALGRNADVQASCFALAEAAAWLKAADSTLGRMAWLSRLCQVEDREEPVSQQYLPRCALAHCFAAVRDRLFRFDEDLASLRRGYYPPQVYAATLLLRRTQR